MAPIEAIIDGVTVLKSSTGYSTASIQGIEIIYYGDDYGGYVISEKGKLVEGGSLQPGQETQPIKINEREVPPIEKGQPPTKVADYLHLRRI